MSNEGTRVPEMTVVHSIPLTAEKRDELLIDIHGRVSRVEGILEERSDEGDRISSLEKKVYAVPGLSVLFTLLAFFGFPHTVH